MNLNQRQLSLLKIMLDSDEYITTEEYAENLFVTSRTIKSDLNTIRHEIKPFNLAITSKTGKGVKIKDNSKSLNEGLRQLRQEMSKVLYNFGDFRSEYNQRAFILYRIIVNKIGWFSIDDLADSMSLSRTVINQEMPEVKNRLDNFDLYLEKSTSHGLRVAGSEVNIRVAIIDSFERNNDDYSSAYFLEEYAGIDYFKILDIRNIISNALNDNNCSVTSIMLDRITIAFFISMARSLQGVHIQNEDFSIIEESKMFKIVNEIVEKIDDSSLNLNDICFLTLYCLSHITVCENEIEKYYPNVLDKAKGIFKDLSGYLLDHYEININDSGYGYQLLSIVIRNLLISKYKFFNMYFSNSIREYTKLSPILLDMSYRTSLYLNERYDYVISRGLLYSLSLFFDLTYKSKNIGYVDEIKINIVGNYELFSAEIYKNSIVKKLPFLEDSIEISNTYCNDEKVLNIVIDNNSIDEDNVIKVKYYIDTIRFYRELIEKIIDMFYAFPSYKALEIDNIISLNNKVTKNELFIMISSIYTNDINRQIEVAKYLEKRERILTYGNMAGTMTVFSFFNLDKKGITIIDLEYPIQFKNWMVNRVLVVSMGKSFEEINMVYKCVEWIMNNYIEFEELLDKEGKNVINKILRKVVLF